MWMKVKKDLHRLPAPTHTPHKQLQSFTSPFTLIPNNTPHQMSIKTSSYLSTGHCAHANVMSLFANNLSSSSVWELLTIQVEM